jgi:hypothetical protein
MVAWRELDHQPTVLLVPVLSVDEMLERRVEMHQNMKVTVFFCADVGHHARGMFAGVEHDKALGMVDAEHHARRRWAGRGYPRALLGAAGTRSGLCDLVMNLVVMLLVGLLVRLGDGDPCHARDVATRVWGRGR